MWSERIYDMNHNGSCEQLLNAKKALFQNALNFAPTRLQVVDGRTVLVRRFRLFASLYNTVISESQKPSIFSTPHTHTIHHQRVSLALLLAEKQ